MTCMRLLKCAKMHMTTSVEVSFVVGSRVTYWLLFYNVTVLVCYNVVRGVSSGTNFDYTIDLTQ